MPTSSPPSITGSAPAENRSHRHGYQESSVPLHARRRRFGARTGRHPRTCRGSDCRGLVPDRCGCPRTSFRTLPEDLIAPREELVLRDSAGIDIREHGALRLVLPVLNAGFALQHAPCLAALDAEEHQLPGQRPVLDLAVDSLHLDEHAEVRDVRAMFRNRDSAGRRHPAE